MMRLLQRMSVEQISPTQKTGDVVQRLGEDVTDPIACTFLAFESEGDQIDFLLSDIRGRGFQKVLVVEFAPMNSRSVEDRMGGLKSEYEILRNSKCSLEWLLARSAEARESTRRTIIISNYPAVMDPPVASTVSIPSGRTQTTTGHKGSLRMVSSGDNSTLLGIYVLALRSYTYLRRLWDLHASGRGSATVVRTLLNSNSPYAGIYDAQRQLLRAATTQEQRTSVLFGLSKQLDDDPATRDDHFILR